MLMGDAVVRRRPTKLLAPKAPREGNLGKVARFFHRADAGPASHGRQGGRPCERELKQRGVFKSRTALPAILAPEPAR